MLDVRVRQVGEGDLPAPHGWALTVIGSAAVLYVKSSACVDYDAVLAAVKHLMQMVA